MIPIGYGFSQKKIKNLKLKKIIDLISFFNNENIISNVRKKKSKITINLFIEFLHLNNLILFKFPLNLSNSLLSPDPFPGILIN